MSAAALVFTAACNDAARCTNACQTEADCGFIAQAAVDSCADVCADGLDRLSGACRKAESDVVRCLQFASCRALEDGTACADDIEIADATCDEMSSMEDMSSMDDMGM